MKFIEMSGATLMHLLGPDEMRPEDLRRPASPISAWYG